MTPLLLVLDWWKSLGEFPRDFISASVCFRLVPNVTWKVVEDTFRSLLEEQLPANCHIGRVLAIRAVIDFEFTRYRQRDASAEHLENVEMGDRELRCLSNAALGRIPQARKDMDAAFDAWQLMCAGAISDASLVFAELKSIVPP